MGNKTPKIILTDTEKYQQVFKDILSVKNFAISDETLSTTKLTILKNMDKMVPLKHLKLIDKKIENAKNVLKAVKFLKNIGIACGVMISIIEIFVDNELSEEDIKKICKEEISKEITSFLITNLLSKMITAKMHLEDNKNELAESLILQSLNLILTHHSQKDFEKWTKNMKNVKGSVCFLFKILVLNMMLIDFYDLLSKSEHKSDRVSTFKKGWDELAELTVSLRLSDISCENKDFTYNYSVMDYSGDSYMSNMNSSTGHYFNFEDKFFDRKFTMDIKDKHDTRYSKLFFDEAQTITSTFIQYKINVENSFKKEIEDLANEDQ